MKLLHVINSLETGGAQRLVSDLLPLQKQAGIDVSILVFRHEYNALSQKIANAGIKEISLDESNFKNPHIIFRLRRIFRDYDIVHVHLFPASYMSALASVGLKTKMVFTEHSTFNRRRGKWYFRPIEKFIYKQFDRIVSISQQTQDALQQWLKASGKRFEVINNGVDISKFNEVKKTFESRTLIMVSRFVPAKDQLTVIKAMTLLDKDVTLRFVGDGPNLELCKAFAKELCVADRVEFLGTRTDIPELIASSYIGIQSSHWEGFGLTAVEYMACGKPVVASDVEGLKQVVDGAGLLFRNGDALDLASKIKELLNDREYYNKISASCRKRSSFYDITVMADKYIAVYKDIIRR